MAGSDLLSPKLQTGFIFKSVLILWLELKCSLICIARMVNLQKININNCTRCNFFSSLFFLSRMFTASPGMQQQFKFAKNKSLKQLETSPRLAIHASNVMNVICQVPIASRYCETVRSVDPISGPMVGRNLS